MIELVMYPIICTDVGARKDRLFMAQVYGGREARNGQRYGGHGWEAWGTSQSQRQGGTDHKKQKSVDNTTSFFFSNFPHGFGELDMHKVFQRWARVKEVFISRRLNKWGRRFGFVRFF